MGRASAGVPRVTVGTGQLSIDGGRYEAYGQDLAVVAGREARIWGANHGNVLR
ncbi:MAG: hypothetical protein OER90_09470 [Gemmatimonadota bacterium]|nr:hypothetical protein [Gemmatimonadota bacterium]